jgi:hypothetical protein
LIVSVMDMKSFDLHTWISSAALENDTCIMSHSKCCSSVIF